MPDPLSPQTVSLRRLAPLAVLVLAGTAFVLAGGHRYLTFSALAGHRAWLCGLVARWRFTGAALYVAAYAAVVALSVPGAAILTIAGGLLFGTWLGGLCAVVGAASGAVAIFLAARAGLGGLAARAGPFVGKLEAGFRADAFNYLLFLRLVPLFPFWLVNLVPALAGVGLPTFLVATIIGIIPGTFVYASLGNGLGVAFAQPDLGVVFRPSVLIPVIGLAVLALVPVVCTRRQRKGGA
ncbi:MAG TPA: VTT domain-containing protein [Stellaceae bacterium]|nr:VTT domain-containing protein [Stellaceae bacterium]